MSGKQKLAREEKEILREAVLSPDYTVLNRGIQIVTSLEDNDAVSYRFRRLEAKGLGKKELTDENNSQNKFILNQKGVEIGKELLDNGIEPETTQERIVELEAQIEDLRVFKRRYMDLRQKIEELENRIEAGDGE